MVVIVFGLPGSGKSFFASRLANKIGAAYINSDRVRKEMLSFRTYSEEEKLAVYEEMLNRALQFSGASRSVVLDGTFYKRALRQSFAEQLQKSGPVVFMEVKASEEIVFARLRQPRNFSDADEAIYQKIKHQWEPLDEEHLVLESTNDNIDDMLGRALNYLKKSYDKRGN